MANYNLNNTASAYYSDPNKFGNYQFTQLSQIVDNFLVTFCTEGKILEGTRRGEVQYHANRAMQELSFDTFKSVKSHEIEVCPSLCMPMPHDYVNYVKLTWVDDEGIEHVIYPMSKTSNPFAIQQDADCSYVTDILTCFLKDAANIGTGVQYTTSQQIQSIFAVSGENFVYSGVAFHADVIVGSTFSFGGTLYTVNNITNKSSTTSAHGGSFYAVGVTPAISANIGAAPNESGNNYVNVVFNNTLTSLSCAPGYIEVVNPGSPYASGTYCCKDVNGDGVIDEDDKNGLAEQIPSNTTDNWKTSNLNANNDTDKSNDTDVYDLHVGKRYGLEPSWSQTNGWYYIDDLRGKICFSSDLQGKTIILKYISDSLGTAEELQVHKLAEEAMYKWIAYGCLSVKAEVPEYLVNRYKREKFAETRKAKIRLSNVKIEEIAQQFRNMSKHIKS